jgi:hypothetical protein
MDRYDLINILIFIIFNFSLPCLVASQNKTSTVLRLVLSRLLRVYVWMKINDFTLCKFVSLTYGQFAYAIDTRQPYYIES